MKGSSWNWGSQVFRSQCTCACHNLPDSVDSHHFLPCCDPDPPCSVEEATTVPCPFCFMVAGHPCVNHEFTTNPPAHIKHPIDGVVHSERYDEWEAKKQ